MQRRRAIKVWVAVSLLLILAVAACVAIRLHRGSTYQSVDLQSIGSFPFDENHGRLEDVPPSVRRLDGRKVRIQGSMIPMDQAQWITQFAVIPTDQFDNNEPPPVTQVVVAQMPAGSSTAYFPQELRVDGTFHVSIKTDDGWVVSIFSMDVDHVTPAPPPLHLRWLWLSATGIGAVGLLIMALKLRARTLRKRSGLCRRCGYDLRATPGRCPECGTMPSGGNFPVARPSRL